LLRWILFNLFALGILALDFGILRRRRRAGSREALARTAMWFGLAVAFAIFVFFWQGRQVALEFVTGYVIELSLSIDNLFLFLVIFHYFVVPEEQQHRVLFWGILGAMAMRAIFILVGVGLVHRFHWIFYILGGLLIYSGFRLAFSRDRHVDPSKNSAVKAVRLLMPVTDGYHGEKFFIRNWQGKAGLYATPLFVVLAVIETTDVLFAIDSIPAVLAITLNAFIVYSANVFAIMGLRSMFFAVSGLMRIFRFLHVGLAVILVLIGGKMVAGSYLQVPTLAMLGLVGTVLFCAILASVAFPKKNATG
jgi:tellurite resistance protein TerC